MTGGCCGGGKGNVTQRPGKCEVSGQNPYQVPEKCEVNGPRPYQEPGRCDVGGQILLQMNEVGGQRPYQETGWCEVGGQRPYQEPWCDVGGQRPYQAQCCDVGGQRSPQVPGMCEVGGERPPQVPDRFNVGGQKPPQVGVKKCEVGGQRPPRVQVKADASGHRPPQVKTNPWVCVTDNHDVDVCHGTNERRRDLIDQIKIFLTDFDDKPCTGTPSPKGKERVKPLGEYPEYIRKHCQSWMPASPSPPLITSVATHDVRPTEDANKCKENDDMVTYVDVSVKPPPPSCDCAKRNGLQDQCTKPGCNPPTPQCLASNPGPCCPPSLGLTTREANQKGNQACKVDYRNAKGKGGDHCQQTTNEDYGSHYRREADIACEMPYTTTQRYDYGPRGQGCDDWTTPRTGGGQQCIPMGQPYTNTATHRPQQQGHGVCENWTTPGTGGGQQGTPMGQPYNTTTTYRPQQQWQGQQYAGACSVGPSQMPSGKKYLCCPQY